MKNIIPIFLLLLLSLTCMQDPTQPKADENSISGSVNLGELSGATGSDILVYLVSFNGSVKTRMDSVNTGFYGEYEFIAFPFGSYGVEAQTVWNFSPLYYGFRDGNFDGYFNNGDALTFSSYGHINQLNIPMYGDYIDTSQAEREPNDDVGALQDVGVIHLMRIDGDVSSGGFIPPNLYLGDLDLYKFECVWDGSLDVNISWIDYADLDLFLYDQYVSEIIAQSATGGSGPEQLYRDVYRGDKFVVVVCSMDNFADYNLEIRIQ